MRYRLAGAVVVALGCAAPALALAADASAQRAAKPARHTIVIEGVRFQPDTLKVRRGDTVVWINKDPFPHNVVAAGAFQSGPIAVGASWRHVAQRSGEFSYVCTLHPNMKGTLNVE